MPETLARCRPRCCSRRRYPRSQRQASRQRDHDFRREVIGRVLKSIHETRYGELLGIVMVGPHVTDLIEAGVVALDAESTVETVADGMAAHPTLSEAIKEAGLVALGRPIHIPIRKRAAARA